MPWCSNGSIMLNRVDSCPPWRLLVEVNAMLQVSKVKPKPDGTNSGAVNWNLANPSQSVQRGDRIVSVNNSRGGARDLVKLIKAARNTDTLVIRVAYSTRGSGVDRVGDNTKLGKPVLSCIDAGFCNHSLILQHYSRSTGLTRVYTAPQAHLW